MSVETLDPRHNAANDKMLIPYPFTGRANSKVRVPRAAMVQGEAFVKARIVGWFRYHHDRPQPGKVYDRIPDEQFDPNLFQPQG